MTSPATNRSTTPMPAPPAPDTLALTKTAPFAPAFRRYQNTTQRTSWETLPRTVRTLIVDLIGGPPVDPPATTTAGFTRSFAALMRPESRPAAFVRAVPEAETRAFRHISREARVLRWLPAQSPAPRLWQAASILAGGQRWHVAVTEPIGEHCFGPHLATADLHTVHDTLTRMHAVIGALPATLQPQKMTDNSNAHPGQAPWFYQLADGHISSPPGLPTWLPEYARQLAAMTRLAETKISCDTTCHGGLRPDRIAFTRTGSVRFTGWNTAVMGPAWGDWLMVLLWCRASGHAVAEALTTAQLSAQVPDELLDALLATFAATNLQRLSRAAANGYNTSTAQLYREIAVHAVQWIAERQGWPVHLVVE